MREPSTMDRHLFASSDSPFDTAWETVATSATLPVARAGRLEERVPWAADLSDRDRPPVLVGAEGTRSPLGMLPMAFLPLDGRFGLSISGVVLDPVTESHGRASRGGSRRPRVATHTLLFDEKAFRRCAGFPLGLLAAGAAGVSPRGWFGTFRATPIGTDSTLPAVVLAGARDVTATFERARLAAVRALARRALDALGEEAATRSLAGAYRALEHPAERGRIAVGGPGCPFPVSAELVLLTWLTLPLEDRIRVYWSTGAVSGTPAPLLVPWTNAVESGRETGGVAPVEGDGPEPVVAWARLALAGEGYGWASRRADVRRASLLEGSFRGPDDFQDPRPPLADLAVWVERELAGRARLRGLGAYLARYIGWTSGADRAGAVRLAHEIASDPARCGFPEGLVWALAREGVALDRSDDEARLAIRAGVAVDGRPEGLAAAVGGLELLIRSGGGITELCDAVHALARDGGEAPAREMWRIGLELLQRWDRYDDVPVYLDAVPGTGRGGGGIAADVAAVLSEAESPGPGWQPALAGFWRRLIGGVEPAEEGLHRLAWAEYRRLGETSLAAMARRQPDGAAAAFSRSFMASNPALPVYLELRKALQGCGVPPVPEVSAGGRR